ncbi:ElyC/SanA/YdcF family protein [Oceanirhabdus sp. W0125-5]|uniref:ElyC/SanA/YdcF family protein n=1 Tax=Oceanirhabdus sp. W0125-5 TaxID=2999116 RepID=UPI0022F2BC87|nr:ElyC/SanA/YdcF family protein [Oceanirhabdus sp. W0125-5]WBW94736.1 YdcF family protein [Oceanirhabdus sp. W0125-5]
MNKRKIFGSILLIVGFIGGIYSIIFFLTYKKVTLGIDIIIIISILMLINGILKLNHKKKYLLIRICEKVLDFIVISIGIIFFTGEMLIQNGKFNNGVKTSGSMVIVGYTNTDDEKIIEDRIDRAYQVYEEINYYPTIIVSNRSKDLENELILGKYDVRAMELREKMYEKGAKRYTVKIENEGESLFENLRKVKKILNSKYRDSFKSMSVRVITSDYNVFLANLIGQELGLSIQPESVETPLLKAPQFHVMEYIEIFKTFFFELLPYIRVR